ncbi:DNA polymerase Y family protein [Peptoniphilus sp.]|jgi:DNA polymerase-4|uniref:DNA polymerase Y family protein n=1 Tax=Peptoniphilus sp. TaxID=1971214 RepID=UPI003D9216EC
MVYFYNNYLERDILHVDMNSFYVSVELRDRPEEMKKAVAVGGDEENRHGIILAKTPLAKKYGVKTGEPIWQAKKKCPDLVILPPHYDKYIDISKRAHRIYYSYTNQVEPFGMDECFLDVTGSRKLFGDGHEIGEKIKNRVREELKVTVSVGRSFNKVFAKLASDEAGHDEIFEISRDNFREIVWSLEVDEMIMIGSRTKRKLNKINVYTLGDLAKTETKVLKNLLGINGVKLKNWANGYDDSNVLDYYAQIPIKTIGRSITCSEDLLNECEVRAVIQKLSQDISKRLIENKFLARGIHIGYRNHDILSFGYDRLLDYPTNSSIEITNLAMKVLREEGELENRMRAIYIRAINLVPDNYSVQTDFFKDIYAHEKSLKLESAIYSIRKRYGNDAITYASLLGDIKMPDDGREMVIMPHSFFMNV